MLKPSEMHQLDQELPKRVRARLVSDCEKRVAQPTRADFEKKEPQQQSLTQIHDKSSGCPGSSLQPTHDERPAQSLKMWEFMVLIKKSHVVEDKLECKTRNKNIMIMEVYLSAGLQRGVLHIIMPLYFKCTLWLCFI